MSISACVPSTIWVHIFHYQFDSMIAPPSRGACSKRLTILAATSWPSCTKPNFFFFRNIRNKWPKSWYRYRTLYFYVMMNWLVSLFFVYLLVCLVIRLFVSGLNYSCKMLRRTLRYKTIFGKWMPFKYGDKCFLFHLKFSFCSQDISFFLLFGSVGKWLD